MYTDISKFISLILRHKPEVIGIKLDEHGWAKVTELIEGISRTRSFNMEMLEEIVHTDEKQRYSFNEDKTLIRANQGHSIPVDVELEQAVPPEFLWHGTGIKYVEAIEKEGLIPKSRLYVHLSKEYATAINVGARHGMPVVYKVSAKQMVKDGYSFKLSANGVWLTEKVPVKYLKRCNMEKKITIRKAELQDVAAMLKIYNDEEKNSTATFDIQERTLEERTEWFRQHGSEIHPIFVAEIEGCMAGYVSLSKYREKEAYKATVELSVYVDNQYRRMGVANSLMEFIVQYAKGVEGIHCIVSVITSGNAISEHLHKKYGFVYSGTLHEVGMKFGEYRGVDNYELIIGD